MPSTSSSSSSSSFEYCKFPECSGDICQHLTNWVIYGISEGIENIYVQTTFLPATNTQQVELYSDNSYYNLIAFGQVSSITATTIDLIEVGSSAVSGSVDWDSTPLDFSYSGFLNCEGLSSQSSSSSIDSSSSSSTSLSSSSSTSFSSSSSESESSSSSQCCSALSCEGINCNNFSNWNFSGLTDNNSNSCSLYVGLLSDGVNQQVRVYKDQGLTLLVAVGQSPSSGSINLIEQNSSNLTGSVSWDGTLIYAPSTLFISCGELSSSSSSSSSSVDSSSSSSSTSEGFSSSSQSLSSSSSSSSVDSSSSSSSELYTTTSSSSTSNSSSSSSSNSSSSSSSSIDSSSSSSESFGNFSSSSSSSAEIWDQKKPLLLGISSAANISVRNRVAQTFYISTDQYNIGKVYVYLYRYYGLYNSYSINLSLYECDSDGKPDIEIANSSINASTVDESGWYNFYFGLNGQTTPESRYLSLVLSHEGDEDNYVLWGYDKKDNLENKIAWLSSDLSNWQEYEDAVFAFKIVDEYEPFSADDNAIIAPPTGNPVEVIGDIAGDPIQIEYEDTIVSFVVDSSGSMGSQDRYNNRKDFVNCLYDNFKNNYKSDVLFDILTFGGKDIEISPISNFLGTFSTINLDLSKPSRATYTFSVINSYAEAGDVYEIDGNEYEVRINLERFNSELVTLGSVDPIVSGFLNKVSGNGDSTIEFSSFSSATINDPLISYGFKNLENSHTYNIGPIYSNAEIIDEVEEKNWLLFSVNTESPSISQGSNAPNGEESIDIVASSSLISRKIFTTVELNQAKLTSILYAGNSSVEVDDSSAFSVGDFVDIVEGEFANINRQITDIDGNTITFTPEAKYPIENNDQKGSIVQSTISGRAKTLFNPTTAKLLVRDVDVGKEVTFYFQNINGDYIEWDFRPFAEWESYNIFFFGKTALLPISLFETDGTPLPDGTRVDLFVDQKPVIVEKYQEESSPVTKYSAAGENRIYLSSVENFSRGEYVDIIDKSGNIQTEKIEEVSEDDNGQYIEISGVLLFDVSPDLGTTVAKKIQQDNSLSPASNIVSTPISCVDVTPIINNGDVDSSLLRIYDIDRVPYSTPYEDLNLAREYIQKDTLDMPTKDGNSTLRVLPITEDILETISEKKEEFSKTQSFSQRTNISPQLEVNEGDKEEAEDIAEEPVQSTQQEEEINYSIETPVYSSGGIARSSMSSYETELEEELGELIFPSINISGIENPKFLSKDYEIYSSVSFFSEDEKVASKLFLDPFNVYFISPILIDSVYSENHDVNYYLADQNSESCDISYVRAPLRGHYASDGRKITLNYTIAEEFSLVKNGVLQITMYSNRIDSLEGFASLINFGGGSVSQQFTNIKPLKSNERLPEEIEQAPYETEIDKWRLAVKNNPYRDLINTADERDLEQIREQIREQIQNSEQGDFGSSTIFYKNPHSWTFAEQYEEYNFYLPVVNGKASFEIPSSDIVSLLFIEASYEFGDSLENEHIVADAFFISNPITIGEINPKNISPSENQKYELGVGVEYLGGESVIQDNTQVNFSFPEDNPVQVDASPTASVTDNGWAGGVFIGPLDPIPAEPISPLSGNICPASKDIEVKIEAFHVSGYTASVTRKIRLSASSIAESPENFIFYADDATSFIYSDGSINEGSKIIIDLDDSFNPTDVFVGEEGVQRLKGKGQPDGEPRIVTTPGSIPSRSSWGNGRVEARSRSINKNIGHQQPIGPGGLYFEPWFVPIQAVTSYLNEFGNYVRGEIANGTPFLGAFGSIVVPKPIQSYVEPLGIEITLESSFIRDGVDSSDICATITWKGDHLKNTFTLNPGTEIESTINYPFPKVRFESGICLEENIKIGTVTRSKDARNLSSGCLVVGANDNAILSSYSVQSGLFRSDIHTEYDGGGNIISQHTHETEIDSQGNGSTTKTIVIYGTVVDHDHQFVNYQSNASLGHSHGLRSVAITSFLPTENIDTDFVVNGYVIYDPTSCEPFENEPSSPEGNRMMFATLKLPANNELARTLVTRIEIGNDLRTEDPIYILDYQSAEDISQEVATTASATFYTASDIEETTRGFDVKILSKFSEYTYIDDLGNTVIVPEEIIQDGSRTTVEITTFRSGSSSDITLMAEGVRRDYMNLKFKVLVSSGQFTSNREFFINISSSRKWYPFVRKELPFLTNDEIYISNAINNFGFFGSSQIYDAIKVAAESLSQYQNEDESLKEYKKIIFLISDGDENSSDFSLNQSIDSINFINGVGEVSVYPIQLGKSYQSDFQNMKEFASIASNDVFFLEDNEESEVKEVCSLITNGENLKINRQVFSNEIIFEEEVLPTTFSMLDVVAPNGTNVIYRIRTSIDGVNFSEWSDYLDYSEVFEFDESDESKQIYLQYELDLVGNEKFDTPIISSGPIVNYYKPREFVVFFQPVNVYLSAEEYISSIHISSEIDKPETSTIDFLFTQSESVDLDDYIKVEENRHFILPNRFNEILLTENLQNYIAINGGWPDEYSFDVYRITEDESEGVLVPQSEYTINSKDGSVNFKSSQNSGYTFFISLFFSSSFRVAARIKNYTDDPTVINHIGIMYNVSSRISRDESGSIINIPINRRIN
jgi:hypothetical protein